MDIILTGIARSGTTLSCSLLNKLPQCVALHEPMNPAELVGLDFPDAYLARVASFFAERYAVSAQTSLAVLPASSTSSSRAPSWAAACVPVQPRIRPCRRSIATWFL